MIVWLFENTELSNIALLFMIAFLLFGYSYIAVKNFGGLKMLCQKIQQKHDCSINQKRNSRNTIGYTKHIYEDNRNNNTRTNPSKSNRQFTLTNKNDVYNDEN